MSQHITLSIFGQFFSRLWVLWEAYAVNMLQYTVVEGLVLGITLC